jgi:predicted Fe-Mo cluster-binding NifX family protein
MIVAIPVSEQNVDAKIDERFGRCPFFCFYNTQSSSIVFKENNLRNGSGGIGPQVSEFLANNGVKKVYAIEIGPKAKNVLDKLKIEIQLVKVGQLVREIIEMFTH